MNSSDCAALEFTGAGRPHTAGRSDSWFLLVSCEQRAGGQEPTRGSSVLARLPARPWGGARTHRVSESYTLEAGLQWAPRCFTIRACSQDFSLRAAFQQTHRSPPHTHEDGCSKKIKTTQPNKSHVLARTQGSGSPLPREWAGNGAATAENSTAALKHLETVGCSHSTSG